MSRIKEKIKIISNLSIFERAYTYVHLSEKISECDLHGDEDVDLHKADQQVWHLSRWGLEYSEGRCPSGCCGGGDAITVLFIYSYVGTSCIISFNIK